MDARLIRVLAPRALVANAVVRCSFLSGKLAERAIQAIINRICPIRRRILAARTKLARRIRCCARSARPRAGPAGKARLGGRSAPFVGVLALLSVLAYVWRRSTTRGRVSALWTPLAVSETGCTRTGRESAWRTGKAIGRRVGARDI